MLSIMLQKHPNMSVNISCKFLSSKNEKNSSFYIFLPKKWADFSYEVVVQHFPRITGMADVLKVFRRINASIFYKDLLTTGMLKSNNIFSI